MVVLDTNHFTEFADASPAGHRLMARIEEQDTDVFTCIVAVEETCQGWLALLHRQRAGRDQLAAYARFQMCLEALLALNTLKFDEQAADIYHDLHPQLSRIGSMDLKIAAICIAHDAMLLSRNLRDFEIAREDCSAHAPIHSGRNFPFL